MAHRIVSDEVFLATAIDLFRTYGFEGVSLKQLADATGLEKASLYYRYPGGKDAIVMAIAEALVAWLQVNMFDLLAGGGSPRKRVSALTGKLRDFYAGGTKPCLMEVLSILGGSEELQLALKMAMLDMVTAFSQMRRNAGMHQQLRGPRPKKLSCASKVPSSSPELSVILLVSSALSSSSLSC